MYRARSQQDPSKTHLEFVDKRTIRKFTACCGGQQDQLPATVDEFLTRQQFITHPDFIVAVRLALSRLPATGASGPAEADTTSASP